MVSSPDQPNIAVSAVVTGPGEYWKQFSSYSNWITPTLVDGTSLPGNFTFSTSFALKNYDPSSYFLHADVSSDDALVGIKINGVSVSLQDPCSKTLEFFKCTVAYQFSGHFVSGTNTVSFIVNNVGGILNPTGLNVKFNV